MIGASEQEVQQAPVPFIFRAHGPRPRHVVAYEAVRHAAERDPLAPASSTLDGGKQGGDRPEFMLSRVIERVVTTFVDVVRVCAVASEEGDGAEVAE